MKDSLKWFMGKFPSFLKKNEGSNFNKVSTVFNDEFKDLFNQIVVTRLSNKLNKRLIIYKEQKVLYRYNIVFKCNLDNLKSVTIFKNDFVIFKQDYELEDGVNSFEYVHEDSSSLSMPNTPYLMQVETYDEIILEKGFPENDTVKNNAYDHDLSLDEFGKLFDIPRRTYTYFHDTNYELTEPPFNNRKTEDDYNYMNRILYYIKHMQDIPLPVLEIWKLYGIDLDKISLKNRKDLLCKMYKESNHPQNWEPRQWEHKDPLYCPVPVKTFFFVTLDNYTPLYGAKIHFNFIFTDMFGENVETKYTITVYLNDTIIVDELDPKNTFTFDTGSTSEYNMRFHFVAVPLSDEYEEKHSDFFDVVIKDCATADWYVDIENGDDENGTGAINNPFKTLQYALSKVEGVKNTISLKNGTYIIDDELTINNNVNILGCSEAIIKSATRNFFKVTNERVLSLSNITLQYSTATLHSVFDVFTNHNINNNPLYIRLLFIDGVSNIDLEAYDKQGKSINSVTWLIDDYIILEAQLLDSNSKPQPIAGETIEFYKITE